MSRGTWTVAGKTPPRSGAVRIGGPRPMRFGRDLYGSPRSNSRLGDRRDFHSDFARVQVPFLREVVPDRPDRVHVPVPIPQDGSEPPLEVVDHADHAPFEPIRFPAAVDDVEEHGVATAECDVVPVSHLDAPDVPDAHAVERVVHEVLNRGEHGRDEIGVFVRRDVAREMDEGRAARVGEIHMFNGSAKRMQQSGHAASVAVAPLIPSEAIIWDDTAKPMTQPDGQLGGPSPVWVAGSFPPPRLRLQKRTKATTAIATGIAI